MSEFIIPGGCTAATVPANLKVFLGVAQECLATTKANGTWRRYAAPWRRAKAVMVELMAENGLEFNCANIRAEPAYYVRAVAAAFLRDNTLTGVDMACSAIRWAFELNGMLDVYESQIVRASAMRNAVRLQRTTVVHKMQGVEPKHVRSVSTGWGHTDMAPYQHLASTVTKRGLVQLMMAAAVGVGFSTLSRFSDLCTMVVGGIYWCDIGVQVCMTIRKNNQNGEPRWHPIPDTGHVDSVVAVLRRYVRSLGFTIPEDGVINSTAFLFRTYTYDTSSTHWTSCAPRLSNGSTMMKYAPSKDYTQFLKSMRRALRATGMSSTLADKYGTQSLRSGGDTHLYRSGAPADLRQFMGRWATPSVEHGYLRVGIKERFNMAKLLDI